jgi:hypothetical protein
VLRQADGTGQPVKHHQERIAAISGIDDTAQLHGVFKSLSDIGRDWKQCYGFSKKTSVLNRSNPVVSLLKGDMQKLSFPLAPAGSIVNYDAHHDFGSGC